LVVSIQEEIELSGFHGHGNPINNLTAELKSTSNDKYDVLKVYRASTRGRFGNFLKTREINHLELIWKRPEKSKAEIRLEKLLADKAEYDRKFDEEVEQLRMSIIADELD